MHRSANSLSLLRRRRDSRFNRRAAAECAQDQAGPESRSGKSPCKSGPLPRRRRPKNPRRRRSCCRGPTDAAVQTILDTKPKTPADLMQAVVVALGARSDRRCKTAPGTIRRGQARSGSVGRFDSPLRQRRRSCNWPTIRGCSPRVCGCRNTCSEPRPATAHDPARLAAAVKQFGAPSADAQRDALATLHDGGAFSVPPLLAALADPAAASIHPLAARSDRQLGHRRDASRSVAAVADSDPPRRSSKRSICLAAIWRKESSVYLLGAASCSR